MERTDCGLNRSRLSLNLDSVDCLEWMFLHLFCVLRAISKDLNFFKYVTYLKKAWYLTATFLSMVGLSQKSQLLHGFHSHLLTTVTQGPLLTCLLRLLPTMAGPKLSLLEKGLTLVSLLPVSLPVNVRRCQGGTALCVACFQLVEDKQTTLYDSFLWRPSWNTHFLAG